jgi:hypothetical protein
MTTQPKYVKAGVYTKEIDMSGFYYKGIVFSTNEEVQNFIRKERLDYVLNDIDMPETYSGICLVDDEFFDECPSENQPVIIKSAEEFKKEFGEEI